MNRRMARAIPLTEARGEEQLRPAADKSSILAEWGRILLAQTSGARCRIGASVRVIAGCPRACLTPRPTLRRGLGDW